MTLFSTRLMTQILRCSVMVTPIALVLSLVVETSAAQKQVRPVADRVVQAIDDNARVTLEQTMHPLANQANDRGAVADGLKLERMQIVLKRSEAQEAELKQLIVEMHTPGNPNFAKWLTAEEFGRRFGPSESDVASLSGWLQSRGFKVIRLNAGRQTLEISGSAGQFRDAFKAQIHTYEVTGAFGVERHSANAANPQIPAALAPIFGGFASLNNFRARSYGRRLGTATYNPATHESAAEWTTGTTSNFSLPLSPGDFAVQYNLPNQATAGKNDGAGQSIAIVNDANINISFVNRFRSLFGLPANPPQIIIDGNDPGVDGINNSAGPNGHSGEAYLDVEWAGAVAPQATVNLVIGADTELGSGLLFAAEQAVYSNLSPVISISFGQCEQGLGSTNAFFSGLWEQAAAQGITVVVSSGDSGSAGCDGADQAFAVNGQAVNGFASTPYNLAVGGTDFYYAGGPGDFSTYWNLTPSNAAPVVSLLKPVPEQPWNDSQYGLDVFNYYGEHQNTTIAAAGGGASNCITETNSLCSGGYGKPSWQTGKGVPQDAARDTPDVSLFASNGSNNTFYPVCEEDGDCEPTSAGGTVRITGVGGTSASAPSFAGVMALVNQQYGRQGQAGFVLYPLATQFPAVFNDVTVGTNTVPCNTSPVVGSFNGTTYQFLPFQCQTVSNPLTGNDDTYGTSAEGEIGLSAGVAAYDAGPGYDLASGLGTVNVSNLLADWGKITFGATAVTLSVTPPSGATLATIPHGSPVTVAGTVTGTGTPTGDVAIITDSAEQTQQGLVRVALANGVYNGTLSMLPGGTYDIFANYGGDGANASSSSSASKVQVTVVPEASTTTLTLYAGGLAEQPGSTPVPLRYGQQVILNAKARPSDSTHTSDTEPTGTMVFTDGGASLDTALVNTEGDAEFFGSYAPGTHQILATYSGDNSYSASTSTMTSFTVTADTPTFIGPVITNLNSANTALLPGQQALIVGVANGDLQGNVVGSQNALAPAGTLTMTGGPAGATTSVTLVPAVDPYTGATQGIGTFVFPGNTNGTRTLTFKYVPSNPTYYNATSASFQIPFNAAAPGLLASTTTATATPMVSPASVVQLTATISGASGSPAPTGTITFYTSDTYFGAIPLPTGSGNSTTVTVLFNGAALLPGTNPITVQYQGDGNYAPSLATATILNPESDFQMVPATTLLNTGTTGIATDVIQVTSTNSFAGAVALTCKGAGGVTCLLSTASLPVTAGAQSPITLTVGSGSVTKTGTYNVVLTGSDATGNYLHTLGFEVVVPELTVATGGSIALSAPAITVASQGASGNSTVTVTPSGGFTGSIALTCAVTASPAGAINLPTCAVSPATLSVTSAAAVTTTLSVMTTAQTTARLKMLILGIGGSGVTMATLFLLNGFGVPVGRRGRLTLKAVRTIRILSVAALFALIAGAAMGCGGSGGSSGGGGGGGTLTGGTTKGSYTVTVTATPATGSAVTTTVGVAVN